MQSSQHAKVTPKLLMICFITLQLKKAEMSCFIEQVYHVSHSKVLPYLISAHESPLYLRDT